MTIKRILKIALKFVVAPLLALIILSIVLISYSIVGLVSYRAYLQGKTRKQTEITTANGIESLEKVTLGGVEQWIFIRARDKSNPVLLYLHGGPGGAEIAITRYFHDELLLWDL